MTDACLGGAEQSRKVAATRARRLPGWCPQDRAGSYPDRVNLEFSGETWTWKSPAPWHFIAVADEECGALEAAIDG